MDGFRKKVSWVWFHDEKTSATVNRLDLTSGKPELVGKSGPRIRPEWRPFQIFCPLRARKHTPTRTPS